MDRDQALKIADRIMDRVEQDRALHRDAIADEVIAGFALAHTPTWIGFDWASDNTSDMSVMGIITRAYDRIGMVPISPSPYGKSPAMAANEAWANIVKSIFPPPPEPEAQPPIAVPGIKLSNAEVLGRGWSGFQMGKYGYRYNILSDEWVA